jgi:hypothetical protein
MIMEDEMTSEGYNTHVYVEDQLRALPVRMYTDELSEVCSIQFGNSFTLNVVTPQDLIDLAADLDKFAEAAHELHYNKDRETWQEEARIQEKLVDRLLALDPATGDTEKPPGAASWKDPNDPINW